MRALVVRGLSLLAVIAGSSMCISACASGTSHEPGDGGVPMDSNRPDSGRDANPDTAMYPDAVSIDAAGTTCGTMVCTGFTHCVDGRCEDYPACRGDGTCPTPGDICIARRCVPGEDDPDNDGSPASEDCDETNPMRSPLLPEICNGVDDDCDMTADDGDPAALCPPGAGVCIGGSCSCPPGTFDVDLGVPGCECTAAPAVTSGLDCASAIELGAVSDSGAGQTMTATGNALPVGREVWYHFRAVDSADTACDNFRVRVRFTDNPDSAYDFYVRQGACGAPISCGGFGEGFQDYVLATDFRADIGGGVLGGECPCTPPGAPVDNVSPCSDNSSDYYVRVRRAPTSALSCSAYTLEISNGV